MTLWASILCVSAIIGGVLIVLGIVFDFCDTFIKFVGWAIFLSVVSFIVSFIAIIILCVIR